MLLSAFILLLVGSIQYRALT